MRDRPSRISLHGSAMWIGRTRTLKGIVPCIQSDVVEFLLAVDSGMLFNERVLQDFYRRLSMCLAWPCGDVTRDQGEGNVFDVDVELQLNERIDLTAEAQMIRSGPVRSDW